MSVADRLFGWALLSFSATLFLYYTTWVLVIPFINKGHFLHNYFLPQQYAITIPITLLCIGLTVIFTFLGWVMVKSKK